MRATTAVIIAALVLTFAGTPSLTRKATAEVAAVVGGYRRSQGLAASHESDANPDIPPQVERWRPLLANYFPPESVDWALSIVACESGGDPEARNSRSSAAGLFQFLRRTWDWVAGETGTPSYADGGPFSPLWSVKNAAWLLENGGESHWRCTA